MLPGQSCDKGEDEGEETPPEEISGEGGGDEGDKGESGESAE